MSHSLCLVRPNTPEADHSLLAYKLKQIALFVLYYLLCCWVLFQTSHCEVVLISQRLMTEVSTSFALFKLRMSNDHRQEFMGSAANEWSGIHCLSAFITFPKQHLCLHSVHKALCMCMPHFEKNEQNVTHTGSYQRLCFSARLFFLVFAQVRAWSLAYSFYLLQHIGFEIKQ